MRRLLISLLSLALVTLSGCIFAASNNDDGSGSDTSDTSSQSDADVGGDSGDAESDDADAAPTCSGSETLCDGECVDTSSDPDHCSACGKTCPSDETNYAVACVSSSCETLDECAEDYVDVDGDPSNGCECEVTDPADPPADGVDANCDGIDGNASAALFVKEGASGDGRSADTPMGSLSQALSDVAADEGLSQVLVAQGAYPPFSLVSNVALAGGYSGNFRDHDPSSYETVVERADDATGAGDLTTVEAQNVENTLVASLRIVAADAVDPGASTVAVHAKNSDFELRALTLEGGQAADGADGAPVSGPTSCDRHAGGVGGSPATFNPCDFPQEDRAMSGGTGEPDDTTGGLGGSGGEHDCGAVALGSLTCSTSINADNDAEAGAPGQDGTDGGVPTRGVGSIANGFWEPRTAASPAAGTRGAGGGGGGAGGNCGSSVGGFRTGGNGGNGGPGGCGGKAGNNGLPGGASILVLSVGSEVTLTDVTGIPGTGGSGGKGSAGGVGENVGNTSTLLGDGGATAPGGDGGNGGDGGAGGDGGDGAGGCGGPAYGVAFDSASTITGGLDIDSGDTFDAGQPGDGANDAPDGCIGVAANKQPL